MGIEQAPHGSQRLSRTERRAATRKQKKEMASKSFLERHLKAISTGTTLAVGGALVIGGIIFLRGQDGRVPLPTPTVVQKASAEQSKTPIVLSTISAEPVSGATIEAEIYKEFPELEKLFKRQSEVLKIDKTNLAVVNLSNIDVNLQSIAKIYSYLNGVARQFQQNGWYYPRVNYSYNNQPKQLDIYAKPSVAEKRGLVLLPAEYEIPGLNMPNTRGATIYEPFEITFLRIPKSADPNDLSTIPGYTDEVENIRLITIEACQSSVFVSSPQDTIPRSFIAHEIFCNSLGEHIALAQTGSSIEEARNLIGLMESEIPPGIIFNPLPPDQRLYPQIPKFNNLFIK